MARRVYNLYFLIYGATLIKDNDVNVSITYNYNYNMEKLYCFIYLPYSPTHTYCFTLVALTQYLPNLSVGVDFLVFVKKDV
jgi:hypothetical protein